MSPTISTIRHASRHPQRAMRAVTVAQCQATALAMKAIRAHVPYARLVQTEDVGRVFATEHLAYQAGHENERRWLALDLLAGRVTPEHPFHGRLLDAGIAQEQLSELQAEPCPPDFIGIDYYLTSDRMLDERIDLYPDEQIGGNGIDIYVDSAAVRSVSHRDTGLRPRIDEVWTRYHLPIVVTELHNGSTRDEQVRWLLEGWQTAHSAREDGVDVRAVTAWSLFGAVDWNSMLSARDGYYESGAFDVRTGAPRPTALANVIAALAQHGRADHPLLDRPGWWRDESSLEIHRARPLLLVGFGRMISVIEECCTARRLPVCAASPDRISKLMKKNGAWAAIQVDERSSARTRTPRNLIEMLCRFPEGSDLLLRCGPNLPKSEVAHAFLDLIIDGQRGAFELSRSEPNNQYAFAPLPGEIQVDLHLGRAVISSVA